MNNYKFNGQELQDELGLNLYDMDLRDYDPAIARWTGVDPVTHHSQSPYNAFDGNPVFWADPSGADSSFGTTWIANQAYLSSSLGSSSNWGQSAVGGDALGFISNFENNSYSYSTSDASEITNIYNAYALANGFSISVNTSSTISAQVGLSEESFNFESTTSNWQAAGVTDLSLTVQNLTNKTKEINFELEVGLPITLKNGTKISPRLAQSASADAANQTAAIIGTSARLTNGRFYNAPAIVKYLFAKTMQRNLNSILSTALGVPSSQVGSRVNSSIISNITPTKAVWNNVSAFQQLGIWMRSWF